VIAFVRWLDDGLLGALELVCPLVCPRSNLHEFRSAIEIAKGARFFPKTGSGRLSPPCPVGLRQNRTCGDCVRRTRREPLWITRSSATPVQLAWMVVEAEQSSLGFA
jgi:hypothetical protein